MKTALVGLACICIPATSTIPLTKIFGDAGLYTCIGFLIVGINLVIIGMYLSSKG